MAPAFGGVFRGSSRRKSGSWAPALHKISAKRKYLKFVWNAYSIRGKTHHSRIKRWRSASFKPACRAPWVRAGLLNQPVPDSVHVDVAKPRQIRLLVSKQSVPILKPNGSAGSTIDLIDVLRRHRMQVLQQSPQSTRLSRFRNKMVVIREDRPGLELPSVLACERKQRIRYVGQALRVMKEMRSVICSGSDDIGPRITQTMDRCMRPVWKGRYWVHDCPRLPYLYVYLYMNSWL